ncbi:MAG: phage head-tail adapter protein [Brevundimonas sp.]|nr:MAG: phage head-tail adapter protein [Brevundimonas sp.]
MRIVAGLFERVETTTPMGGQAISYEALGSVWIALGARRRRAVADAGAPVRIVETAGAETRADPRLSEGRVLRFGGADWVIGAVEAPAPGRARLSLERVR